jgi:hypothetical protein
MAEMDIVRLCRNFIYFIRQASTMATTEEVLRRAPAVYEHYFDCHELCGSFCKRKLEIELGNTSTEDGKFYRSKVQHEAFYQFIKKVFHDYLTIERITELTHGADTNVNESMNVVVSWYAPKNKTYSGSCSLINRVHLACNLQPWLSGFLPLSLQTYWYHCNRRANCLLEEATGSALPYFRKEEDK